jgi:sugar phosphate isomerase/epimerase
VTQQSYRFGISEFTSHQWTFERDVERYSAHGVDMIEVCQYKLRDGEYEKQLGSIPTAGLTVSSVQTRIHSVYQDSLVAEPSDPSDRVKNILDSIDAIAPHVPKGTPFVVITGKAPGGNNEEVYRRMLDVLPRLADRAAHFGMRVAYEPLNPILFHTDTALWGLDAALELVERVNHPALGVCCDFWNIFETPSVQKVIEACGKRIFLVQVSDWRRPHANADRRCLGDGSIPTPALLQAVRAAGYGGPYVLEIFSATSLPDSLWTADMDDVLDRNIVAFDRMWDESLSAEPV